jgi:tetratricopeptide (TPR) repeat protein
MAVDREDIPSTPEVKKQLQRLLRSEALRAAPSQEKLLRFVVESAFADNEITEKIISLALFPLGNYDPDTSNVRVTATNLRNTLAKYYDGIGSEDPVIITLPPGKLYRPVFALNPRWEVHRAYRRGMAHMDAFLTAESQKAALELFEEAIKREPSYAPAHAALAEVSFREALYSSKSVPAKWIKSAESAAREALSINSETWRAHVVLGGIHCGRFDWDQANLAFQNALRIAPLETGEHLFYLAFLAATGRGGEAFTLAKQTFTRWGEEDVFAMLRLAAICYLSPDRFLFAVAPIWDAIKERKQSPHGYILYACFACAAGLADCFLLEEPQKYLERGHRLFGKEAFPGLAILGLGVIVGQTSDRQLQREKRAALHEKISLLEIKSRKSYVPPVQLALAHLAAEELDYAVLDLERAVEEGDPKMALLHLWPLFDPLREQEGFKALIRRMKLPYSP